MVYTHDLKSCAQSGMRVRIPPRAPKTFRCSPIDRKGITKEERRIGLDLILRSHSHIFMKQKKFKMRVVRGAFINSNLLDEFGSKTIEKLDRNEWLSIDEIVVDIEQIKELQKIMTRHYDDATVPWYMDGYGLEDKNDMIVAFGADDGAGGKIFHFDRNDKEAIDSVVAYGISKGIPKEQMDFMEIDF